jgi:RPC5 protein
MDSSDPIVASYDVFLTDSQIARYVMQYPDRELDKDKPYEEQNRPKPTGLRLKPKTGLVEVEVPINTSSDVYDVNKGLKYGEAMKQSRVLREGGAFGLAGGFNSQSGAATASRVKIEGDNGDMQDVKSSKTQTILRNQTLAGRIKEPEDGEPVYMLGAFRGCMCDFNPLSYAILVKLECLD